MESTEVDKKANSRAPSIKENGFHLRAVAPQEHGEGLPYAPVDWPEPGDVWNWRAGRRIASSGHFMDRYLYPPRRFYRMKIGDRHRRKFGLASKLSVKRFIQSAFPDADVEAFFALFSWRIPSKVSSKTNGNQEATLSPFEDTAENSESDSQTNGVACKAGNKKCISLMVQTEEPSVAAMPCDICCSEPRFCRNCCCILCCMIVNSKHGGFSYIKCEALVSEDYICGHVAHVDCALRSYMAGTVGGSIGLDVEYYCRRCDARTDLIPHARRLLQTCESIDSCEEVEKILNAGICILRGSQKNNAIELLNQFESAIVKLKCGANLKDLWKVEQDVPAISTEQIPDSFLDYANEQELLDSRTSLHGTYSTSSDYQAATLALEDEIDQTLYELRKSQATEYSIAEERLYDQKNYIDKLYQQLERERSELKHSRSRTNTSVSLTAVKKREDQIKKEVAKLGDMEKVAKGFGRTSKTILNEHFGLGLEE